MMLKFLIKRLTAIAAAAAILSAMTFSLAVYTDVSDGAWYFKAVSSLSQSGIIDGFPDGAFYPDEVLTAAQFIKMVYCSAKPGGDIVSQSEGNWAEAYYDELINLGLIDPREMYADELSSQISRYDAARIAARYILKINDEEVLLRSGLSELVKDYSDIPERYLDAVRVTYCSGVMGGYGDGSFNGKASLTRAEAAVIILRLTDKSERLDLETATAAVQSNRSISDNPETPAKDASENAPAADISAEEWFADAAFFGDSLTHGLSLYGDFHIPDYYYSTGISVFGVLSGSFETPSGNEYSFAEALERKDYSKVYVLFGINEMGSDADSYYKAYSKLIDKIREIRPEAVIYLQSVLPVSQRKDSESTVFKKSGVLAFNEVIMRLAEEKDAVYMDVYSEMADENGFLPESETWDGVHLYSGYYIKWSDFLKSNIILS